MVYTTKAVLVNQIKTAAAAKLKVVAGAPGSGNINVYLDGVLNQTISSANLNAETVNISL
jgi:hypothetical protein